MATHANLARGMKRLLICTPTHTLHGGVERIVESLAARLPEHGYDVTFALARGTRFNDPDRFRAEYPNIKSIDIDGTSGTATGRQRAVGLADALDELRRRGVPFTCVVAGTGPQEAELRSRLPDVDFLGWQTTEQLYDRVYPELDLLLHFAAWEGVPIAPREAMAHGVVPVMARFRGI